MAGFEPVTTGSTDRRSAVELHPPRFVPPSIAHPAQFGKPFHPPRRLITAPCVPSPENSSISWLSKATFCGIINLNIDADFRTNDTQQPVPDLLHLKNAYPGPHSPSQSTHSHPFPSLTGQKHHKPPASLVLHRKSRFEPEKSAPGTRWRRCEAPALPTPNPPIQGAGSQRRRAGLGEISAPSCLR